MDYFYWYAGLSVLLITALAMNVSRVRMQEQIGNGDGGNSRLRKAIRAHMNTIEHALPFGLIVIALALQEQSQTLLAIMAFGFLGVRIANSYSMLGSKFRLRQITAALTYLFQVIGAISVLLTI